MTREQKILNQPRAESRLIVHNACNLKLKPNKMKIKFKSFTPPTKPQGLRPLGKPLVLTTKNNGTITVAEESDGRLYILDADGQVTRQILPDGIYSSEGLSDLKVQDGKFVQSKYSLKKGIPPRMAKIPMRSIHMIMKDMADERKAEISKGRMEGKF